MKKLKSIFPEGFDLIFSGGEPLLHKQLVELCNIAYQELPLINIKIYTNGILFNTIKDNELIDLNKKNVKFYLHLYPIYTYLKTYEKQINRFKQLNIDLEWYHGNIYFNKFSLNRNNTNCYNNLKNNQSIIIKENNIYPICPSIQMIQYKLLDGSTNFININDLNSKDQIINLFNNIDCSYCNAGKPLSSIYVNNYSIYENLLNVYDIGSFLSHEDIFKNISATACQKEIDCLLNRAVNGWMDIYIPFSAEISKNINLEELKYKLLTQSDIEKYNLYFVSIDEDLDTQMKWFNIFGYSDTFRLNTYFLKGKSLYLGEKAFFNNSRIINHYILDVLNINDLNNPNFLSNILKNKGGK